MAYDEMNPKHILAVRRSLSRIRLAPYDKVARSQSSHGLILYEWNTEASAACYASLQVVEVCLRNAIHSQLTQHHQARGLAGTWVDDPLGELDRQRQADIKTAVARLKRTGKLVTADAVVAELTFGFWRYLLTKKYEHLLWTPAIRHGFPHLMPQQRQEVAEPVERLHQLRNRIAHHEPIHLRDLISDHHDMMTTLAAICPHTHGWARSLSTLPEILFRKPLWKPPVLWLGPKR